MDAGPLDVRPNAQPLRNPPVPGPSRDDRAPAQTAARIHNAEAAGAGGSPLCDENGHEFDDAENYEHGRDADPISMNPATDAISWRAYPVHRVLEVCYYCGVTEWTEWETCDCEC